MKITYKAEGKNKQENTLSDGLDFYGDDNVKVSVDTKGKVQHKLSDSLKNINSISSNNKKSK